MKKILILFFFAMGVSGYSFSQGNGNNGNNGNWPPIPGQSSTACGIQPAIQPVAPGGNVQNPPATEGWPMNKVVEILRVARPAFLNTNLGQMIQAYNNCSCVITYLGGNHFKVTIGGLDVVLDIEI